MRELTEENTTNRVPARLPNVGQVIDERYRVESVIATGGMGVILRAEHLAMERKVAIKLLHPQIAAADETVVERFHREVQLAKTLDHRNTIRLYDSGRTQEGLLFVAMEYLEGETLDELLARRGALRVWRAVDIAMQILDGLAEAHARDFIHRDIKPSNVFIARSRRGEDVVKLLDFGIAKPLVDAGADLTGTGTICGTPHYVAPEYLRSEPIRKACDVYAVGLILLEMLRGRRVFEGDTPMETMMMRLHARPAIPFLIEESPLAGVIRKAVARQPGDRYADADEMFRALRPVAERLPAELLARRVDRPGPMRVDKLAPQRTEGSSRSATRVSLHREEALENPMSSRLAIGAVVAIAALATIGVGLLVSADGERAPSRPVAQAAKPVVEQPATPAAEPHMPPRTAPAAREFVIDSQPLGARVTRGTRLLGKTPLNVRLHLDELPTSFTIQKDGYLPASVQLSSESSDLVFKRLNADPSAAKTPPAKPARAIEGTPRRRTSATRPASRPARKRQPDPGDEISDQKVEEVLDTFLVD